MWRVTKSYFAAWLIVIVLTVLAPAKSIFGNKGLWSVFFITLSYLILVFTISHLSYSRLRIVRRTYKKPKINVLFITSFFSLIGLFCFIYDKVLVQGIDYSNGIASARYQFIENSASRDGISSIYSVFGYLFGSVSFIGSYFCFVFWDIQKKASKYLSIFIFFVTIVGISLLTGGRTSILLLLLIFLASIKVRSLWGLNGWPFSKKGTWVFLVLGVLLFIYLLYVFSVRANTNKLEGEAYARNMFEWMQVEPNLLFDGIAKYIHTSLQNTFYFLSILWVYLVHSNWIFQGFVGADSFIGDSMLINYRIVLTKLGVSLDNTEWLYHGRFVSWPGALYHDFGILGVFLVGLLHGLALGISSRLIGSNVYGFNILPWLLFFISHAVIISSPFIVIIDVLMFPSLVASFFLVAGILFLFSVRFK